MRHLWLKILPRTNTVYLIQISKLPIRGLEKKLKKKKTSMIFLTLALKILCINLPDFNHMLHL